MNCRPQNGTESYTAPKSEDMRAPHARRHNLWCAHTQQYHHPSRLDIRQDLALRPMLIRRTHTAKHRPTSDCVGWYLFQTMLVMFRTMLRKVRIGYSVRYCCCKVWVRHGMFVGLINSISPGLLGCPQSRGGGGVGARQSEPCWQLVMGTGKHTLLPSTVFAGHTAPQHTPVRSWAWVHDDTHKSPAQRAGWHARLTIASDHTEGSKSRGVGSHTASTPCCRVVLLG